MRREKVAWSPISAAYFARSWRFRNLFNAYHLLVHCHSECETVQVVAGMNVKMGPINHPINVYIQLHTYRALMARFIQIVIYKRTL